ncbi:Uncharacterised protein [Yersinia bercovieri]|uniref:Uncharacterized protein n=1 Tax=Yersinia bercovieri ATCC 43970 TaxID=349968 RepID=A0ABM9Y1W2_YERBE|nr:hypothetical protein yberc0001_20130 [Yersinia bercovieri ATCC 43970]CNF15802.1 Uncharacterised protein [Yersinia bercovieri]CNI95175.1 Uncharacterised protein [Yersinia bercovieri]
MVISVMPSQSAVNLGTTGVGGIKLIPQQLPITIRNSVG